jgi:ABC-type phosphate transport system substrate-binding protein
MRMLSKVLAGSSAIAAMVALSAAPALADPPSGTTPGDTAVVGTGSDTTQYLMDQASLNYDATKPSNPLYSFDAVNPNTLAIGDTIVPKANCAGIPRPDGSSAGIDTLSGNTQPTGDTTNYCEDYGRSSRARESTDPPYATGGVAFVQFAHDAITYATRDKASGGSNAPESITQTELTGIYNCTITNWDQLSPKGPNDKIKAYIPQSGSGTRSTWLTALGLTDPGTCVSDLPTTADPGGALEENEGINKVFDNPNAIFPFSIGSYQSQLFRSPKCIKKGCLEVSATKPPCTAGKTQNKFGCNETGYLALDLLGTGSTDVPLALNASVAIKSGATTATVTLPTNGNALTWGVTGCSGATCSVSGDTLSLSGLSGAGTVTGTATDGRGDTFDLNVTVTVSSKGTGTATAAAGISEGFNPAFFRTLYNVVRYDPNTTDHIPGSESGAPGGIDLEKIFGSTGYLCSSAASTVIENYGFLPLGTACGSTS